MRFAVLTSLAMLISTLAIASDNEYVMNFDLKTLAPDGAIGYSIQLQGIHLSAGIPFHGNDLGEYDYFLTMSKAESGKAKLTIEFYEYESRRKTSDVVSEIVTEIDIILGAPAKFEGKGDTFGIDLAFSVDQK
jgi:hypothetical protein